MEINASLVIWWDNTSARQPHVHVHELLALWEQECWTLTSVLASIIRSHHSFASNYANSGWRDDQRCLLPNEGWYPLILQSSPILPLVIIHPSIYRNAMECVDGVYFYKLFDLFLFCWGIFRKNCSERIQSQWRNDGCVGVVCVVQQDGIFHPLLEQTKNKTIRTENLQVFL